MSKGSRRRPISASNKAVFESNWDRIFNKQREEAMWEHHCKHNGNMSIAKGEQCSWCGAKEDD